MWVVDTYTYVIVTFNWQLIIDAILEYYNYMFFLKLIKHPCYFSCSLVKLIFFIYKLDFILKWNKQKLWKIAK